MTLQKIGRYLIEGELGRGAMSKVYRARDPSLDRVVAIKVINFEELGDGELVADLGSRFLREAKISAKLQHPHVITVYDVGEDQGMPYMVMELIKGQTLAQKLQNGPLDSGEVLVLMNQLASGFQFAHDKNVIHRDIKPSNIMITLEGDAKILDFGLAKPGGETMTKKGLFLGTPKYCSPEQIKDRTLSPASDVFSLALVTHEMLTGKTPFEASDLSGILYKIVYEAPRFPSFNRFFGCDESAFRLLFTKALEKKPERRYQSVSAFFESLEDALTGPEPPKTKVISDQQDPIKGSHTLQKKPASKLPVWKEKLVSAHRHREQKEQQLRSLKEAFLEAYGNNNIEECKRFITVMENENINTSEEQKALAMLESKVKAQRLIQQKLAEEEKRQMAIARIRKRFSRDLDHDHPDEARKSIDELEALGTNTTSERKLLDEYLQRKNQQHIFQLRKDFHRALEHGDLKTARKELESLQETNAAAPSDISLLEEAEKLHISNEDVESPPIYEHEETGDEEEPVVDLPAIEQAGSEPGIQEEVALTGNAETSDADNPPAAKPEATNNPVYSGSTIVLVHGSETISPPSDGDLSREDSIEDDQVMEHSSEDKVVFGPKIRPAHSSRMGLKIMTGLSFLLLLSLGWWIFDAPPVNEDDPSPSSLTSDQQDNRAFVSENTGQDIEVQERVLSDTTDEEEASIPESTHDKDPESDPGDPGSNSVTENHLAEKKQNVTEPKGENPVPPDQVEETPGNLTHDERSLEIPGDSGSNVHLEGGDSDESDSMEKGEEPSQEELLSGEPPGGPLKPPIFDIPNPGKKNTVNHQQNFKLKDEQAKENWSHTPISSNTKLPDEGAISVEKPEKKNPFSKYLVDFNHPYQGIVAIEDNLSLAFEIKPRAGSVIRKVILHWRVKGGDDFQPRKMSDKKAKKPGYIKYVGKISRSKFKKSKEYGNLEYYFEINFKNGQNIFIAKDKPFICRVKKEEQKNKKAIGF